MNCYENVQTLFGFIQSVEACQSDTEGQCSEECRTLIDDSNGAFGCCVNIPIDFRTAGGETDLVSIVNSTFENCNKRRRDACMFVITIQPELRELVDINHSLSFEHIVCIDTAIQSRNDLTQQCKDAASTLTVQINSNSLLGSVSIDHSALSDFCKSSCGPEIINTWMSCGAYDDIQAKARFLAGLCGLHQGEPCYAHYDDIEQAIDDTIYCATRAHGLTCPIGCMSDYQNLVEDLGCCFDVFIDYIDAVVEREEGKPTIKEINVDTFTLCESQFPSQCLESALTSATSSPEPTACPSSAGSTMPTFLLLPVALIIRLTGFF